MLGDDGFGDGCWWEWMEFFAQIKLRRTLSLNVDPSV